MRYSLSQALLFAAGVSAIAVPGELNNRQAAANNLASSSTSTALGSLSTGTGSTGTGSTGTGSTGTLPLTNENLATNGTGASIPENVNAVANSNPNGASSSTSTALGSLSTGTGTTGSTLNAVNNNAVIPNNTDSTTGASTTGTSSGVTQPGTVNTGNTLLATSNTQNQANVPQYCGKSDGSAVWTFGDAGTTWAPNYVCGLKAKPGKDYSFDGSKRPSEDLTVFIEKIVLNFKTETSFGGYFPVWWQGNGKSYYFNAYNPAGLTAPAGTNILASNTNNAVTNDGLTNSTDTTPATGATGASSAVGSVATTIPTKRQTTGNSDIVTGNGIGQVTQAGWQKLVWGLSNGLDAEKKNYGWVNFNGANGEVIITVEIIVIEEINFNFGQIFNSHARFPGPGH